MPHFEPVGVVRSDRTEMSAGHWANVESRIELDPLYVKGLAGLSEFSHVVVIFHLHKIPPFDPAKQIARNPRGMENLDPVGVFAQRTKFRPNPIGVTAVELLAVDDKGITVRGLDALDGTPVLDIKPYIPGFERKENVRCKVAARRLAEHGFHSRRVFRSPGCVFPDLPIFPIPTHGAGL
jgi:tRNA-Thr(GGU) m(6)t(6)A37 methyltransferase TsaA